MRACLGWNGFRARRRGSCSSNACAEAGRAGFWARAMMASGTRCEPGADRAVARAGGAYAPLSMTRSAKTILTSTLFLALLSGTASAAHPDPKKMALELAEMPIGFAAGPGTGYQSITTLAQEDASVTLAQLKAWGYVTGYQADFSTGASPGGGSGGATQIDSSASVYGSASGAEKSLASSVAACRKSPYRELPVGTKIGDEVHLCSVTEKSGNVTVQVYVVLWRRGRFEGAVLTGGAKGGTSATQAVKLAEVQDKRMK